MANYDNQFFQSSMSNLQGSDGDFIKGDSPQSKIIPKTITENGTYDASADNADGYSKVTVDVAGGGGETFEVNATFATIDTLTVTIDQDFDDVWEAISAGKKIVGTLTVDSNFILNCVGASTTTKGGNAIYFMYEPLPGANGAVTVSVGFGKENDRVYYFVGYGQYQFANN